MSSEVQSTIQTLGEVLAAMAPFAGGSIPSAGSTEYLDWVRWVGQKQEEYARRAMWRRCLTRLEVSVAAGSTYVLPVRFHKPNGLYIFAVDGVDWMETPNSDGQHINVEMDNDLTTGTPPVTNTNFARWRARFNLPLTATTNAIMYYFANPPKPTETTDKLILPGDMCTYGALQEYFRTANQEGSEDKAEELAENRFSEYLGLEVIPDKSELLVNSENISHVNRLETAKDYYRSRPGRNTQY